MSYVDLTVVDHSARAWASLLEMVIHSRMFVCDREVPSLSEISFE